MEAHSYDQLRTFLYPFGFLSSLAFAGRFLIQWLASEKAKESVVPKLFWYFSFSGNLLLFVHCFLQQYFPMYLLQALHMPLALRNINLMSSKPYPLRRFFLLLSFSFLGALILYLLQLFFLPASDFHWIRTSPSACLDHPLIHLIGILGIGCYSLRFWLQWWESENRQTSCLSSHFWHLSLVGASLGSCYFFLMHDWVNWIGPTCALIPYLRNLALLKRKKGKEKVDIVFIALEASGDLLGAKIIQALKKKESKLTLAGIVGPEMRKEGILALGKIESYQAMGLVDVVKKLPSFLLLMHTLIKKIQEYEPSHVIFLDSPSFGLKLASLLKKKKIPVKTVQIVAPSVWAWGKEKRLTCIRSSIDLLIPLYAFEKELFEPHVETAWYGHPLFDESFFTSQTPKSKLPLLALFPGSRPGEVRRNLSLQLDTAFGLQQQIPSLHIGIALSGALSQEVQRSIAEACHKRGLKNCSLVPSSHRYELMESAWAALSKCGTNVLELFLKKTPTVVCYALGSLERAWARFVLKLSIPFYSLPNILAKRMVIQEFIHPVPKTEVIVSALLPLLSHPQSPDADVLKRVRDQISSGIPAEEAIVEYLCVKRR